MVGASVIAGARGAVVVTPVGAVGVDASPAGAGVAPPLQAAATNASAARRRPMVFPLAVVYRKGNGVRGESGEDRAAWSSPLNA